MHNSHVLHQKRKEASPLGNGAEAESHHLFSCRLLDTENYYLAREQLTDSSG